MKKTLFTIATVMLLMLFSTPVHAAGTWSGVCYCGAHGASWTQPCSNYNGDCNKACNVANGGSAGTNTCVYTEDKTTNAGTNTGTNKGGSTAGTPTATNCSVFSEILKPYYKAILIIAPILALVSSGVDIFKAVAAGDEKTIKQAFSSLKKRLLIMVAVLLLPILVNLVIDLVNGYSLRDCGLM
jgi:hypothetical protein